MKTGFYVGAISTALALSAAPVAAATCADRVAIVQRLAERFDEQAIANALSSKGDILEVFASENMATWTILGTLPAEGLTCLVASGQGGVALHAELSTL